MKRIVSKISKYVRPYKMNIYLALICRLVIVMIFYQQGRILFFLFNNRLFPETDIPTFVELMVCGLSFDLTAALYVNSLFILSQILPFRFTTRRFYQLVCKIIFILTNGVAFLINIIDIAYFHTTFARTTSQTLSVIELEKTRSISFLAGLVLEYWYLFLISGMVIFALFSSYRLIKATPIMIKNNRTYYITAVMIMFLVAFLYVGGIRGGYKDSSRPIAVSNATKYSQHEGEEHIVLNTPFSLIRTIQD